jgi:electron transport complex protein RnfC
MRSWSRKRRKKSSKMVRITEYKFYTEHKSIEILKPPETLVIPIVQHIGKPCEIFDKQPGDNVFLGQRLASASAQPFAPIHSPVSGKIKSIESQPHPVLGTCKAFVIENDGKDTVVTGAAKRTEEQIKGLTADQIRSIVFEAGIVGMGGASFPTHIKLNPLKPVDTLIINIAECEP